jgi:hypothetical protein
LWRKRVTWKYSEEGKNNTNNTNKNLHRLIIVNCSKYIMKKDRNSGNIVKKERIILYYSGIIVNCSKYIMKKESNMEI